MVLLHAVNFSDGIKQMRNIFLIPQEIKHNYPTKQEKGKMLLKDI